MTLALALEQRGIDARVTLLDKRYFRKGGDGGVSLAYVEEVDRAGLCRRVTLDARRWPKTERSREALLASLLAKGAFVRVAVVSAATLVGADALAAVR